MLRVGRTGTLLKLLFCVAGTWGSVRCCALCFAGTDEKYSYRAARRESSFNHARAAVQFASLICALANAWQMFTAFVHGRSSTYHDTKVGKEAMASAKEAMTRVNLLAILPLDQRHYLLDSLSIDVLARLAPVCRLWRAFITHYIASVLPTNPDLKAVLVGPGGRPRLARLTQRTAVIVVGGYNSRWNGHGVCDMSDDGPGCEQSAEVLCHLSSAEVPWNSSPPPWALLPSLQCHRADLALVATSRTTMYAIGGRRADSAHATVELLDVAEWQLRSREWQPAPSMHQGRYGHVAACVGDAIFVASGRAEGNDLASAELLRPSAPSSSLVSGWEPLRNMHSRRSYACSAVVGERWYVVGGGGASTDTIAAQYTAESFDANTGVWHQLPSLASPHYSACAVAWRGNLMVLGGGGATEWFDPRQGRWQIFASNFCSSDQVGATAVAHEDGSSIFVIGGMNPVAEPPHSFLTNPLEPGPGASSQIVRIFDLRYPGPLPYPSPSAVPMRVARWCGAACMVGMATN